MAFYIYKPLAKERAKRESEPSPSFKIPEVKPISLKTGVLLFGGVALVGLGIGATIGTYVFFGAVTLAGLIAIAESNKYVKYFIVQGNKLIDISIFLLTIYATLSLGVTIAASLTIAGLGYTLIYAPWVRQEASKTK